MVLSENIPGTAAELHEPALGELVIAPAQLTITYGDRSGPVRSRAIWAGLD